MYISADISHCCRFFFSINGDNQSLSYFLSETLAICYEKTHMKNFIDVQMTNSSRSIFILIEFYPGYL